MPVLIPKCPLVLLSAVVGEARDQRGGYIRRIRLDRAHHAAHYDRKDQVGSRIDSMYLAWVYGVFMYSCVHVFMYSCIHVFAEVIVNCQVDSKLHGGGGGK
jgi:hypothetical protein